MRILTAKEVAQALPMSEAIEGMKRAYAALSSGAGHVPQRTHLKAASGEALFMPAWTTATPPALAVKAVTLFPENPSRGLPLIHAAVLVFDPQTGQPQALLEGGSLTAIRTGAGSGAAIDLLARPDSRVLAVFGAGAQARAQIEAACTVRPIERIWLYDLKADKARRLASEIRGRSPVPAEVRVASSPRQAVAEADVICTATTSTAPVFDDADLKEGVHISAIGAYRPDMREIPPETLARAQVYVDSIQAAQQEAGDLLFALESGLLSLADVYELGDRIRGLAPGRESAQALTVFKSVGVAWQDAIAAQIALQNARQNNLGITISFLEEI